MEKCYCICGKCIDRVYAFEDINKVSSEHIRCPKCGQFMAHYPMNYCGDENEHLFMQLFEHGITPLPPKYHTESGWKVYAMPDWCQMSCYKNYDKILNILKENSDKYHYRVRESEPFFGISFDPFAVAIFAQNTGLIEDHTKLFIDEKTIKILNNLHIKFFIDLMKLLLERLNNDI